MFPIISTDVGTATDILCSSCIIDIQNEIYYPTNLDVSLNYKNVQKFSIINHAMNYEKNVAGICYMNKKRALITGVNGMDGSHLADFLLEKDYEVFWSGETIIFQK